MTVRDIKDNELSELLALYTHLQYLGGDLQRRESSYHCLRS